MAVHVLAWTITVLAEGRPPLPYAVFSHATTSGHVAGEERQQRLAVWLADTYTNAPPPEFWRDLKAVLLEAAWRRAVRVFATRLLQAVEDSPTEILCTLVEDTDDLIDQWDRFDTAANPNTTVATSTAPLREAA